MVGQPVATIWGLLDLMASELQYQAIATRGHCPLSHVSTVLKNWFLPVLFYLKVRKRHKVHSAFSKGGNPAL